MRTLLALVLASLPLVHGQDSLLKSVEPDYDKYSPHLATDFETTNASVTVTVAANGKPYVLFSSSVPLPMAVVMALKDYEFRPQGGTVLVPHGRPATEVTSEVTLNVPVRQSKVPVPGEQSVAEQLRIGPGVAKGMVLRRVQPVYPEDAKQARIQGKITLETLITKQGDVGSLRATSGPFVLIQSAYDAVKQWQFRPYLVNREPVEVLTEFEVVFNLR